MLKALILLGLVFAGPTHAEVTLRPVPQVNVDEFALDQLQCQQEPDSVRLIMALAVNDLVDLEKNIGREAVDCFDLEKTWVLEGLPVTRICGVFTNGIDHFMFPGIAENWTLSEMFPSIRLSLFSTASVKKAEDWVLKNDLWAEAEPTPVGTKVECGYLQYEQFLPRG
jgi:hypothetical protein